MGKSGRISNFTLLYLVWFLAAALAGTVWVAHTQHWQRRQLRAEVTRNANQVATRLGNARVDMEGFLWALSRTREVQEIFRDPALRRTLRTEGRIPAYRMALHPCVANLSGRLERMAEDLEATLLFVVDPSGRCLASSDWRSTYPALGDRFHDREYVQESLGGRVAESYLVGRHSKVLGTYFSVPVTADSGPLGSLVIKIRAETWAAHIGLGPIPVLVCNPEGVVLFSNREAWNLTLLPGAPALPPERCQQQFDAASLEPLPLTALADQEWQDDSGRRWLAVAVPVAHSPLTVHLLQPTGQLQAMARTLWLRAALVVLLGWLAIWGFERVWLRMAALRRLSGQDPLTQLYNRRGFDHSSALEWARALRFERPLAILALDLDHFKRVNDRFGHAAGDYVLRTSSALCKLQLRDMDILARMGGEEFSILLPETGLEQARAVAERIRQAVQNLGATWEGTLIPLTLSIGLAVRSPSDPTLADVLARADQALYRAKDSGRNRVQE